MSQLDTLEKHLRKHGAITPEYAWAALKMPRLAARVHDLRRKRKMQIVTERTADGRTIYRTVADYIAPTPAGRPPAADPLAPSLSAGGTGRMKDRLFL